jgi:hypothetical protein
MLLEEVLLMAIVFVYAGTEYVRGTAVEIVRAIVGKPGATGDVRRVVRDALAALADQVHTRELDVGSRLSDEAVAFNFLCLLDEQGLGRLRMRPSGAHAPQTSNR